MAKNQQQTGVKEKKKGGLFRKIKESFAELKKVTWPTFGQTIKKTLAVVAVVLFFGVVVIAFDYGLSWLYKLLTTGL